MKLGKDDIQTYELITELLYSYQHCKNKEKKEKTKALIIAKMLPMIKRIARTIARRSYDPIDDLIQAGSIGLLKAIDNYNDDFENPFRIYAGYLIIGEMRHYIRDQLNTIRVPAYIQELTCRINSFINTLTLEELENLTNDDVAEVLNIPKKTVDLAIEVDRRKKVISLDTYFDSIQNDTLGFEELFADVKSLENYKVQDTKIMLKKYIDQLPFTLKHVIELSFFQGLTKTEIAKICNIRTSSVSRRLNKAYKIMHNLIVNKKDAVSEYYDDLEDEIVDETEE